MWPFFNRREIRESSFTDAVVSQIVARAGGAVSPRPTATGALEACAGLIGRAFSAASVEGPAMLTAALTPAVLNLIGRELVRRGEVVFNVDVPQDALELSPAADWDVQGGFNPEAWLYRLNLAGPSETTTIGHRPASGVLHFKWAYEPARPWRGLSPIQAAALAGRLSAETAKALADESSGPRGSLLPIPVDGSDPTVDALRGDIKTLNGKLALVESMRGGWGGASNSREAPVADWIARRIGATPPVGLVSLHEIASREIALACGVPTALLAESPTGTGTREAWRQFLFGTVAPLGKLVEFELSRKLDAAINLTWADLRASDLAGRARAFQSMVGGGMDVSRAAGLAGLMDPTD